MLQQVPSRAMVQRQLEDIRWAQPSQEAIRRAWHEKRAEMIVRAREASLRAHNWRPEKPVKIGCCVLGHDGRGHFDATAVGWNNTPRPLTDKEKVEFKPCAEKFGILDCLRKGFAPVGLRFYTNHNQADDVTGLKRNAFCMCSYCVGWMEGVHVPLSFLVESVRPRLETDDSPSHEMYYSEEYTLEDIICMHNEALRAPQA